MTLYRITFEIISEKTDLLHDTRYNLIYRKNLHTTEEHFITVRDLAVALEDEE